MSEKPEGEESRQANQPGGDPPSKQDDTTQCGECGGSGKIEANTNCPKCGGTGRIKAVGYQA